MKVTSVPLFGRMSFYCCLICPWCILTILPMTPNITCLIILIKAGHSNRRAWTLGKEPRAQSLFQRTKVPLPIRTFEFTLFVYKCFSLFSKSAWKHSPISYQKSVRTVSEILRPRNETRGKKKLGRNWNSSELERGCNFSVKCVLSFPVCLGTWQIKDLYL